MSNLEFKPECISSTTRNLTNWAKPTEVTVLVSADQSLLSSTESRDGNSGTDI
jgi:hypothetical protein